MKNALTEKELRKQWLERTCECGSSISKDHSCFLGQADGLTFILWIAHMALKYPTLAWMRRK